MKKQTEEKSVPRRKSREVLIERVMQKFPDRLLETDDDFFDALEEYDSYFQKRYEKLADDQNKLCDLFISNPKMGAFIADVVGGEDALVACVKYFGKDLLECAGDDRRMYELRRANDEYMSRISHYRKLDAEMRENLKNSSRHIERFKASKGMSDEEFEAFVDRVYHLCNHVFVGDLNTEVLELLYKGVNYDSDLSCAEKAAEIKGRNERIVLEKKQNRGDSLSGLRSVGSVVAEEDEDTSPILGRRRRKSVWDL